MHSACPVLRQEGTGAEGAQDDEEEPVEHRPHGGNRSARPRPVHDRQGPASARGPQGSSLSRPHGHRYLAGRARVSTLPPEVADRWPLTVRVHGGRRDHAAREELPGRWGMACGALPVFAEDLDRPLCGTPCSSCVRMRAQEAAPYAAAVRAHEVAVQRREAAGQPPLPNTRPSCARLVPAVLPRHRCGSPSPGRPPTGRYRDVGRTPHALTFSSCCTRPREAVRPALKPPPLG